MKTKGFSVGIVFLALMVCTTCTKDEVLLTPDGESSALKAAPAENFIITLTPTGGDDSDAIEEALWEARNEGPGSVVQLTEGTFYVTRNIRVDGFDGSLKGAGKSETVITQLPGSKIDGVPGKVGFNFSSLLTFRGGDIRIADLTFEITDPEPAGVQDLNHLWVDALVYVIDISVESYPGTVSSSIDNVAFIGAQGNLFGNFNIVRCVDIGDPQGIGGGSHSITNCDFISICVPFQAYYFKSGAVVIGGSPNAGNTFIGNNLGVVLGLNENLEAEVSWNHFEGNISSSVNLLGDENLGPAIYTVEKNTLEFAGYAEGIIVSDYNYLNHGEKTLDVKISGNKLSMNTIFWPGMIVDGKDILVTSNQIEGEGFAGIASFWGDGIIITGNNVQNFTPIELPGFGLGAAIRLNPDTRNCVVVGGSNKTNVVDLGTDNIITGVNTMHGNPPGPAISDAMRNWNPVFPPGH